MGGRSPEIGLGCPAGADDEIVQIRDTRTLVRYILIHPVHPFTLVIYSASNENFVPVNIGFTSSDFDSNSIDEKIESTDDCAIEPVEQAGSGALELGVWFERFQNRTR